MAKNFVIEPLIVTEAQTPYGNRRAYQTAAGEPIYAEYVAPPAAGASADASSDTPPSPRRDWRRAALLALRVLVELAWDIGDRFIL